MSTRPDKTTKAWIRNASDELAVRKGCRFDEERGAFAVEWIQSYCRLYEGEWAGEPLMLVDWQYEAVMRLMGWVRYSDRWQREVRRFNRGSIWVAKKNKKSPTLAAIALYLLCGDGEPGQKVFLGAKDGSQAREITGAHVKAMVEESPELSAECKINENLMRVAHTPTRSYLQPMSSANARTQQSKEGINGSVLIDETHVVDREFIGRISRAGISRSEPLQLEVSTAGDDPDGYGKEAFDYGRKVEAGEIEDTAYFFLGYYAPQDLTDEDLAADPLKYGRRANPALGHTVDADEFLADYERSKATSLAELGRFKQYRLNIWQQSSHPWLRPDDWTRCAGELTEDMLAGCACYAGLDLAKTQDTTSLQLVFPAEEPDHWLLLSYFWLPLATARQQQDKVSWMEWSAAGHVTLTEGDVCDYARIRSDFARLAKLFDIRALVYDPWQAEKLTQEMTDGVLEGSGKVLIEGTGVPREGFRQTISHFAEPTAEFERVVTDGRVTHDGNPVMAWQIGHCEVAYDHAGNKKPKKPAPHSIKKIDGPTAAVMGLSGGLCQQEGPSVYEERGIITI